MEPLEWDNILKVLVCRSTDRLLPTVGQSPRFDVWLNVELPKTQNLRVDLLGKTTTGDLIHFEVQSTNDAAMPLRMLEYGVAILRQYGRFPIQILLYAGNAPLRMANKIEARGIHYTVQIVDLKNVDGSLMVASDRVPDQLMGLLMAVKDKPAVIRRLVDRIARMPENARFEAVLQLLLTCRLRGLRDVAEKEVRKKMPLTFNIATDRLFGPPYRKGVAAGRAEGRREGREALVEVLRRQLRRKFGRLPKWADERLTASSVQQLNAVSLRLFDCTSLEQLFPRHKPKK